MKRNASHFIFPALFLLLFAVVYYRYITLDLLFTGRDFVRQFAPLYNFESDCLRAGSLPLWNPFFNFGFPWLEHFISSFLFPPHLVMGLLFKTNIWVWQLEMLLWMAMAGLGVYFCARELGGSPMAGFLIATSYTCTSQLSCITGLPSLLYTAEFYPFIMLGYLRARRSGSDLSLLAIASIALTLLVGYWPSVLLGAYLFCAYVMLDCIIAGRVFFGIRFLAASYVAGILLAMPRVLPFVLSLSSSVRTSMSAEQLLADAGYASSGYVYFYDLMSAILPVKHFFSVYFGQFMVLVLIVCALRRRLRVEASVVMALLGGYFLLVSPEGDVTLLRSVLNKILPFMDLVRFEFLYWFYPTLFLLLYLASRVDCLFEAGRKDAAMATAILIAMLTGAFFLFYDTGLHMAAYATHLTIAIVWCLALMLKDRPTIRTVIVLLAVSAEVVLVFQRTNTDKVYPYQLDSAMMYAYTTDQNGVSHSFRDDDLVRGYSEFFTRDDLRPPLAAPAKMPALAIKGSPDYSTAESINQKRFVGEWYNTQPKTEFIALMDLASGEKLERQPLAEFIPFDGGTKQGAAFTGLTCTSFEFDVEGEKQGTLVLRQMYDKRWNVLVDNNRQDIDRFHDYFMSVDLPPGNHHVRFMFRDRAFDAALVVSLVTLAALPGLRIYTARRRRHRRQAPSGD